MWPAVLTVSAFAIAMAHVETMIVVYLRRLYYPEGFDFPLVIIDTPTLLLELEREAATLVMLAAYGLAAGRTKAGKLANFIIAFGVWDIFYYVWLKVVLDWPASLLTWDVLFLIPVPWAGPVIAPISVACTMIGMGLVLLHLEQRGAVPTAAMRVWTAQMAACLIIIASFTLDVLRRAAATAGPRRLAERMDSHDLSLVDAGTWPSTRYHDVRRVGAAGVYDAVG
jgi:hypothetical protein